MVRNQNTDNMRLADRFILVFAVLVFSVPAFAKKAPTDEEILKRLENGEGAIVARQLSTVEKEKGNLSKVGRYKNISDFVDNETVPWKLKGAVGTLNLLPPGESNKEEEIKFNKKNGTYVFIGRPGEYIISRIFFNDPYSSRSFRLFFKVNVEPGKIMYIGDIYIVSPKAFFQRGVFVLFHYFSFPGFKNFMQANYPLSFPKLAPAKVVSAQED